MRYALHRLPWNWFHLGSRFDMLFLSRITQVTLYVMLWALSSVKLVNSGNVFCPRRNLFSVLYWTFCFEEVVGPHRNTCYIKAVHMVCCPLSIHIYYCQSWYIPACMCTKEKKSTIFFLILEFIIILIRLQVSLHAVSTFNLHVQRTQKTRLFHQPSHSPATHSPLSRITGSMSQEAPADVKPLLNPTQVYRDRIPSRCMCL